MRLFSGVYLKKKFFCSIFNAVFNVVKINFSRKFLHGTPKSTADFRLREFQANRSVTVKVLSLLVYLYDPQRTCEFDAIKRMLSGNSGKKSFNIRVFEITSTFWLTRSFARRLFSAKLFLYTFTVFKVGYFCVPPWFHLSLQFEDCREETKVK